MKLRSKIGKIELTGSEKQCKWAQTLRDQKAEEIEKLGIKGVLLAIRPHINEERLIKLGCTNQFKILQMAHWIVARVFRDTNASWWINTRAITAREQLEDTIVTALYEWEQQQIKF